MDKNIMTEKESLKFREDLQKFLDEHNAEVSSEINFPQYNILPNEVQLALLILEKHGMVLSIAYKRKVIEEKSEKSK